MGTCRIYIKSKTPLLAKDARNGVPVLCQFSFLPSLYARALWELLGPLAWGPVLGERWGGRRWVWLQAAGAERPVSEVRFRGAGLLAWARLRGVAVADAEWDGLRYSPDGSASAHSPLALPSACRYSGERRCSGEDCSGEAEPDGLHCPDGRCSAWLHCYWYAAGLASRCFSPGE